MNSKTMSRLVPIEKANDDWDIRFWQNAGPRYIFQAAYLMLIDYLKMKGKYTGRPPRLRRTISVLKRRKG